jgi:phosphonate transport system substrate-binding protein
MVDLIAKATSEQSRGVTLIIKAAEKIRDASSQADRAIEQQAQGSRQIAGAVETVSDRTRQISRAIFEQKMGANQIWSSVEKIKDLPRENRNLAFRINKSLQRLLKDSELVASEMGRLKLYERRESKRLKLGVVPFCSPVEAHRKFAPLSEYLKKETGLDFELKIGADFEGAMNDLVSGTTHVGFMTTLTYLKARKLSNVEILAMTLRAGRPFHNSVVITREDSGIKALADLKNRSFAFVDVNSMSGYVAPLAMLMDEGIELNDLSYHNFVGYQDEVVRDVLSGEFDAGAVMEATLGRFKDRGVRIIKVSADIPDYNIAAGPALEDADRVAVKAAVARLKEGSPAVAAVLQPIDAAFTGLAMVGDEAFEGARKVLARVGMA